MFPSTIPASLQHIKIHLKFLQVIYPSNHFPIIILQIIHSRNTFYPSRHSPSLSICPFVYPLTRFFRSFSRSQHPTCDYNSPSFRSKLPFISLSFVHRSIHKLSKLTYPHSPTQPPTTTSPARQHQPTVTERPWYRLLLTFFPWLCEAETCCVSGGEEGEEEGGIWGGS